MNGTPSRGPNQMNPTALVQPSAPPQTVPIPDNPFALYDSKRDFSHKAFKSACYAPFICLDFFTTGAVQVCCENHKFPVGNLQTESLKQIWNGPKIQRLRETLKRYDFSLGCQGCEATIRWGGSPFARYYDWAQVEGTYEWPQTLQFRLSNVCNFACIMCSGLLSSVIRRDRDHKPPLAPVYPQRFFEELAEFSPHLDSMVFSGGEPLLIWENFRIFDMLIVTGNWRPALSICTNGSVWNDRIASYFERLNIGHCTVSIDGATKETFEQVRVGSRFDVVLANLKPLAESVKRIRPRGRFGHRGARLSFSYCLMPVNAHEMPDVFLLAEDWEADVAVNVVMFPPTRTFLEQTPEDVRQASLHLRAAYERIASRLSQANQASYLTALATLDGMIANAQPGTHIHPLSRVPV